MTALDRLVPGPHLIEIDRIDLATPAARVWERVRHGELARSLPIRALFAMRSVASGPHTSLAASSTFRIDHLKSTPECPGFQILVDDPPHEMAVAAIGKVWRLDIPFVQLGVESLGQKLFRNLSTGQQQRVLLAPRIPTSRRRGRSVSTRSRPRAATYLAPSPIATICGVSVTTTL